MPPAPKPPSGPSAPGPLLRLVLYGGSFLLGSLTAWAGTVAFEGLGLFRKRNLPVEAPSPAPAAEAPSAEAAPPETSASAAADEPAPPAGAALEMGACVQSAFAPNSFPEGWSGNFQFLCDEADPRRAAHLLRTELIRAGGKRRVTPGMREWSMLGWYNMASFAAIRGHCCPQPAPLRLPAVGSCPDLAQPLNALVEVVAGHRTRDRQRLWVIRESYRTTVQCLDRAGFQGYYDQWGALHGGEDATFDTMLGRILEGPASAPSAPSAFLPSPTDAAPAASEALPAPASEPLPAPAAPPAAPAPAVTAAPSE